MSWLIDKGPFFRQNQLLNHERKTLMVKHRSSYTNIPHTNIGFSFRINRKPYSYVFGIVSPWFCRLFFRTNELPEICIKDISIFQNRVDVLVFKPKQINSVYGRCIKEIKSKKE